MALLALLSACNDDYNDQFDINYEAVDVKSVTMTLAASDYGALSGLDANKELALAKDPETEYYLNALDAVGFNHYFTADATAEEYLPAFINYKYPNADNGSKFMVTYKQYQAPSAYLSDFGSLSTYDLSSNDYESVWGDKVKASFLSPATLGKIPNLLKENLENAESGDMVVVNYAYSEVEPSIGGGSGEEDPYTSLGEVLASGNGEYTVKGEVIAAYARGVLISDGTGSILVYLNATPNYSVGDVIEVSGTTTTYSGLMQFSNTATVTWLSRSEEFAFPIPTVMSGAELDGYVSSPSVKYVRFTGELTISGSYYNITVEGATRQGSISYPVAGMVDPSLDGKVVDVTGYLIGGSSRFVNVMAVDVTEAGAASEYTPVGAVALSAAGDYKVKGVVAGVYNRGFLLTDGTGYILVYLNAAHDYVVGDVVSVSGKTSKYSGFMQFPNTSEVTKLADGSFRLPAPRVLSAADMEAYLEASFVGYVSYTGTLRISGNYYNVIIDGSTAVQGSISYPVSGLIDPALDGRKVVVEGYSIGTSGGKYLNTMAVSVKAVTASPSTRMATTRAAVSANASALYRYDGTAWSEYTNEEARITVVEPSVYNSIGADAIADPASVLPIYLSQKYPYAAVGDRAAVVYNASSGAQVVEYTKDGAGWIETPETVDETITLSKDGGEISAKISVYMDETFLGETGGMVAQDIKLTGGLSYVWRNQDRYGWTASSYLSSTKTDNAAESWLVTPVLDFTKGTKPVMTFEEAINFATDPALKSQLCTVQISTDYAGDVTKATWEDLTSLMEQRGDGGSWTFCNIGTIDLSEYVGHYVHIAFVYNVPEGAAAPTWEVKNLLIKEDAGAEE